MATRTLTLSDFLLARIAEDEDVLTRSDPFPHYSHSYDDVGTYSGACPTCRQMIWGSHQRALAECEAKRRIVRRFRMFSGMTELTKVEIRHNELLDVLHTLAAVYANHPDYDERWRP